MIVRIALRHRDLRRKGLAEQADEIADVRTSALVRLAANGFHNLRNFVEHSAQAARPESFEAWIYGVVDFAIRDHLRKRFGRAPRAAEVAAGGLLPSKRDLQSHAGRIDDEPERNLLSVVGVTTRLTVAEIMAFIAKTFSPDEVRAVQLYYVDGHGYDAIANALALRDAKDAEQVIRRLNARL